VKKLLLIGGGIAHAEALATLATASTRNADVTVLNPRRAMPWAPMLPGLVAGHYEYAECHYDLAALARGAGARLIDESIAAFDPLARVATTDTGRRLEFDFASIDVGASSVSPGVAGLRDYALLARPAELFLEGWERVVELVREGSLRRLTMVGGSACAVELMLAMQHRLRHQLPADQYAACGFGLVASGARLLEDLPEALSTVVEAVCLERGISLLRGAAAVEVTPQAVHLANGARLLSDLTVWADGALAPRWLGASGLACDADGFLVVDAQLRAPAHPHVFSAGESARLPDNASPPTAVGRAQEARLLAGNLLAILAAQPLAAWSAPAETTRWISLGSREALGLRAGLVLHKVRWWSWRRKDRADRRTLQRYRGAGA
jgi:selenide,water dikinase